MDEDNDKTPIHQVHTIYRVVAQYFYLESILMKGLPCTDIAKVYQQKKYIADKQIKDNQTLESPSCKLLA